MPDINEEQILDLLKGVPYPGYNEDIVSFGVVSGVNVKGNRVTVTLKFNTNDAATKAQVKSAAQEMLRKSLPEVRSMVVEGIPLLNSSPKQAPKNPSGKPGNDPWAGRAAIPGVKSVLAVASGKGGVGKSTVSTNLAIALAEEGLKVGLLDSDIYGPSVHIMMGVEEKPMVSEDQKLLPIEKYNIKMMSMGFIVGRDTPVIWRGPMVNKAVEQFLRDVLWGELDVLLLDLPPGTGDVQLSLVQKVPLTGAVVVTTPQEVSLVDARRGHQMFKKMDIHTFGVVENMSFFPSKDGGEPTYIFGKGGGAKAAEELDVAFLGEIPIDPEVAEAGDAGTPIVARNPNSATTEAFRTVARKLLKEGLLERVAQ